MVFAIPIRLLARPCRNDVLANSRHGCKQNSSVFFQTRRLADFSGISGAKFSEIFGYAQVVEMRMRDCSRLTDPETDVADDFAAEALF